MSIPWWQCIAVAWNRTARGASRNEPLKAQKIHSALVGRDTLTVIRTYMRSMRISA